MQRKRIGIVIFDQVEVLDFCGPFEVFSVTRLDENSRVSDASPFDVVLVAPSLQTVVCTGGMRVLPDYSFDTCPDLDLLIIAGGMGTRREMNNPAMLDFVAQHAGQVDILASVCTGALILGKTGLLDGLSATTHWRALPLLQETFPAIEVIDHLHVVDHGKIMTSAGISAGIEMALYIVLRLYGEGIARNTARYMEYPYPEHNQRRVQL
ncbi:DJ-1/PfpI family protein [Chitinibacter bivalviorum]|uniref:DJ-1/PfpI family protein n=1 Tax=Chitinibacter bivalviorum TaxID=2739434 RepID=A0A7H9BEY8_9NEIS|nr:DJ-1/PfpI family protein [Chitinibacter bivalviorum]QLG87125.1 DJ-1/PfpI family protein [Chitinibacter bivalviorum]